MCAHCRIISKNNFNPIDHRGLDDGQLFVLQFGRKDPDSGKSLVFCLILELMWIHRF